MKYNEFKCKCGKLWLKWGKDIIISEFDGFNSVLEHKCDELLVYREKMGVKRYYVDRQNKWRKKENISNASREIPRVADRKDTTQLFEVDDNTRFSRRIITESKGEIGKLILL